MIWKILSQFIEKLPEASSDVIQQLRLSIDALTRDKKFIKAAKTQLPVYDPVTFIKKFMN